MRLTPRKDEVAHVGKAIDEEHATLDAAAKAAIKAVAEALDHREWYSVASPSEFGSPLFFGIYSSEKEAEKAAAVLAQGGAGTEGLRLVRIFPTAGVMARREGQPLPEDCECGHPQSMHQMEGSTRGRCVYSATLYRQLGYPNPCGCTKFKKHAHPIPTHPTCVTCKQPVAA